MKYALFALLMIALLVGCSTQVEAPQEPDTMPAEDMAEDTPQEPASEPDDELVVDEDEAPEMDEPMNETLNDTIDVIKAEDHVITFEENFVVEPKEITIKVGETVTWKNNAKNFLHTPAWAHMEEKADSLKYGEEWSYTFTEPGEIKWFSTARPTAQGVIYVEE